MKKMLQVLFFLTKYGSLKVHECCFVWLYIEKNSVRTTPILFEHVWFENYTLYNNIVLGENVCDLI
jgi:hypothetical protein